MNINEAIFWLAMTSIGVFGLLGYVAVGAHLRLMKANTEALRHVAGSLLATVMQLAELTDEDPDEDDPDGGEEQEVPEEEEEEVAKAKETKKQGALRLIQKPGPFKMVKP